MRWTQHVERRTTMLRTAKPRGPDISTPISSLRRDDVADDGDKKARSPGRAWSKPLKPAARGMPGVSGEPAVTTLVRFFALRARLRVRLSARHSLRPLISEGRCLRITRAEFRRGKAGACPNPRCPHKCVRRART